MSRKKRKAPQNVQEVPVASGAEKGQTVIGGNSISGCIENLAVYCDYYAAHYVQYRFLYEKERSRAEQIPELEERLARESQLRQAAEARLADEKDARRREENLLRQKLDAGEEENRRLREELRQETERKRIVSTSVGELLNTSDKFALTVQRLWKENSRLRTRTAWLDAQNQRYQRLITRLTNTWYGSILRKIYHLFQKFGWA